MSGSLITSDLNLLRLIWQVTFALAIVSLFIVICLAYRRMVENALLDRRQKIKDQLRGHIARQIGGQVIPHPATRPKFTADEIPAVTEICLDFFRNLTGHDRDHLASVLKAWQIEDDIQQLLSSQHRGFKIRALSLLSYLNSDRSLEMLEIMLRDPDPYIKLSAIRGLARRNTTASLPLVLSTLKRMNWENPVPVADALYRFGDPVIPFLEKIISVETNSTLRVAALQALNHLAPAQTQLNLSELMHDPLPEIRAEVAGLGEYIGHSPDQDVIVAGLSDADPVVRIRAVKASIAGRRLDLLNQLKTCLDDPEWWIRFRAGQAIYNFGDSGQNLLECIGRETGATGHFAREILSEMSAA